MDPKTLVPRLRAPSPAALPFNMVANEAADEIERLHGVEADSKSALAAAVAALYFDDSADYQSALYAVVRRLGGTLAAELMECSPAEAYARYAKQED